jgi:hypothetical protein
MENPMTATPEIVTPQTPRCHACGIRVELTDRYCRACGKKQLAGQSPWYYEPIVVILLGFFVLGAFGIPLVFRSPKFTPAAKWTLSLMLLIYTLVLVGATAWIAYIIFDHYRQISEIGRMY